MIRSRGSAKRFRPAGVEVIPGVEAFERYPGEGGPGDVDRFQFSPEACTTLIREGGGVPILAHPGTLHLPADQPAPAIEVLSNLEQLRLGRVNEAI
jgi:predicted metal-dependent phosphoesterase TrpH